eukprot:7328006-Alexandrium_andersonii.AAC.1
MATSRAGQGLSWPRKRVLACVVFARVLAGLGRLLRAMSKSARAQFATHSIQASSHEQTDTHTC